MHDRLYRSRDDAVIGGVAGGVAKALDLDPSIVRVVWVLLAFLTGGAAGLVYLVMLIVVPQEPLTPQAFGAQPMPGGDAGLSAEAAPSAAEPGAPGAQPAGPPTGWSEPGGASLAAPAAVSGSEARAARRARRDAGGALVFGVILILVGGYFLIREYVPQIDTDVVWPIVVIVVGLLLLFGALRPRARTDG